MPPRRRPSGSPVGSASPEERSATLATAKGDATPTEPPSYVACEAFDGAREGYEFKNGINGVGYYRTGSGPEEKAESETVAGDAVPAPEPAPATKWRDPDDANFDIESVPAMTPEEIKVAEDKERERVTRISALARSMSDSEIVRSIFEQFDVDKDGRLDMTEYGLFLKSIAYSKAWTEQQWQKECGLIGGDATHGVSMENMTTLYTKYRAAKLRVDFANVNMLPGEEVRKLMDEARRAQGGATGDADAAARIAGESQMLTAADMADSKLSADEYKRMQGMLGGSTAKGTKVLAKLNGATEKLEKDSFDANQTLVVMGCNDCVIEVDTTCVKVFLQMCSNVRLYLRGKVITHTLEAYKCDGCSVYIETKIWTAQMDICKSCNLEFKSREDFQTIVSAGCHDLDLQINDLDAERGTAKIHFPTLEAELKAAGKTDINEERTQFKTHFKAGKLATEHVVRLDNGFPTTEDERKEFDRRQEYNMRKLAENSGFNIARKKDRVKLKPNAPCACGSGKKQKKCCGMPE